MNRKCNLDRMQWLRINVCTDCGLLETKVSRVFVETSQIAVYRRRGAKYHIFAQIVTSFLTEFTRPAGYTWFDGHSITDLDQKFVKTLRSRTFYANNLEIACTRA